MTPQPHWTDHMNYRKALALLAALKKAAPGLLADFVAVASDAKATAAAVTLTSTSPADPAHAAALLQLVTLIEADIANIHASTDNPPAETTPANPTGAPV